jgi:hypothetical protein
MIKSSSLKEYGRSSKIRAKEEGKGKVVPVI